MSREGRYTLRLADGRTEQLTLTGKAINRGADGAIYRTPDGRYALKYYHEPGKDPTRRQKVWQMILHPPEDASARHFAWPQALLLNRREEFVGFAMPLLDVASHVSLDLVLSARGRRMQGLPQATAWRLDVAINLARRVAELHAKGHCIIDLKPANLLVHRRSADVAVVDCDGFAVQGTTEYFPAHQFTAGFIAPEAFRAKQAPQALRQPQDAFALAVILFKLINGGLHPYQGVPDGQREIPSDNQNRIAGGFYPYGLQPHRDIKPSPWSVHRDFPRILRETFDRSFTGTQRPSAQDWVDLLEQARVRLKICSSDSDHGHWGTECPHCARARVKIARPTHHQPTPKPTRQRAARVSAQPAPTTPAPTATAPSTTQTSSLTTVFGLAFTLFMLIMVITEGCSGRSAYSPIWEMPKEQPPRDPRTLAWHETAPRLEALFRADHSISYPLSTRAGEKKEPLPYHRFGAFDRPESLSLLTRMPGSLDYLGISGRELRLSRLNMLTGELETLVTYERRTSYASYGLALWQTDPRGLYLAMCSPACTSMHRLHPDRQPISYELPEWQKFDAFSPVRYWHYQLSPEGEFLVLASATQVAVFAVDQAKAPLAVMDLPTDYNGYSLGSISVGPRAESLILGLYKSKDFGIDFVAEILELTRTGKTLSLDRGFAERARAAGSDTLAAYQTLSRDGQTLAVSEYKEVLKGAYGEVRTSTVAAGFPAISIWERDEQHQWRLRQRLDWKGRLGSRRLQPSAPRRIELLTMPPLNNRQIVSESQIHQDLQLSPDGRRLLTGLQTDASAGELSATSYLFDIQGAEPVPLGSMTVTVPRVAGPTRAYPRTRLSDSGNHVAMGWFRHHYSPSQLEQLLHVQVFAVPEPEPAMESVEKADPTL
ncbi:MAG TPA: hypothetical protein VL178_04630 [Pseudomonas sp.]|nr:hypothetical protein [Pseudomonas sp.]